MLMPFLQKGGNNTGLSPGLSRRNLDINKNTREMAITILNKSFELYSGIK